MEGGREPKQLRAAQVTSSNTCFASFPQLAPLERLEMSRHRAIKNLDLDGV